LLRIAGGSQPKSSQIDYQNTFAWDLFHSPSLKQRNLKKL
jgi:hypothetical protein